MLRRVAIAEEVRCAAGGIREVTPDSVHHVRSKKKTAKRTEDRQLSQNVRFSSATGERFSAAADNVRVV